MARTSLAGRAGPAASSDDVASLSQNFTIEATFPSEAEIVALAAEVPAGTRLYLSCPPNHSPDGLIPLAVATRAAGLEPVPHLTARAYTDAAMVDRVLGNLVREANVSEVLVLAGDRDEVAGPFEGALGLIETDLLQKHGIREVNISGYPDGHAKLDDDLLRRALMGKIEALEKRNLPFNITTQFCFDAYPVLGWLRWLRGEGIKAPVRIGVAGPTTMRSLLKFAMRCGVRASIKGALNPKALQLFTEAAPDMLIRGVAEAEDREALGPLSIHYFTFAGVVRTAQWGMAAANGRIEFTGEGFKVIK
ncbi:MAG: methylenetetrahydrofolate reductase [Bradyrhizobiaceae bacterium]|nr:methylenetetrahydrofolate reductase [Bradyrhizobiaceae bacterium]